MFNARFSLRFSGKCVKVAASETCVVFNSMRNNQNGENDQRGTCFVRFVVVCKLFLLSHISLQKVNLQQFSTVIKTAVIVFLFIRTVQSFSSLVLFEIPNTNHVLLLFCSAPIEFQYFFENTNHGAAYF